MEFTYIYIGEPIICYGMDRNIGAPIKDYRIVDLLIIFNRCTDILNDPSCIRYRHMNFLYANNEGPDMSAHLNNLNGSSLQ